MLNCYTVDSADVNDGSGRSDKREVILYDLLLAAAKALNPDISEAVIEGAVKQIGMDQRACPVFPTPHVIPISPPLQMT
jgi:type I restriction enzyme R subunit